MDTEKLPLQRFLQISDFRIAFQLPVLFVYDNFMATALHIIDVIRQKAFFHAAVPNDERLFVLLRSRQNLPYRAGKDLRKFLLVNRFYQVLERIHVKCVVDVLFISCDENNEGLRNLAVLSDLLDRKSVV